MAVVVGVLREYATNVVILENVRASRAAGCHVVSIVISVHVVSIVIPIYICIETHLYTHCVFGNLINTV